MDYGRFVKMLRRVPVDAAAEKKIWNKISITVQKKNVGILSLADLWPKLLVPAAALAAIFIIFFFSYAKQIEAGNFVQHIYSTQYIYETCKYDGLWN